MIRPATLTDAEAIARIYNYYILNTTVTFEEEAISGEEIAERIQKVNDSGLPWIVMEDTGKVVGYAYASKWNGRCAYRFSAESTVYLDPDATGQGFGTQLYTALLDVLRSHSIHAVIAGIALPRPASVALHEKFGFQKVAHFHEVGFKFGEWIDVGYWQIIL